MKQEYMEKVLSMDADLVIAKLEHDIYDYIGKNGCRPKRIFVDVRIFWHLQLCRRFCGYTENDGREFSGIPVNAFIGDNSTKMWYFMMEEEE